MRVAPYLMLGGCVFALPALLAAQAAVEYSTTTAAGSTGAATAGKSTGKSIGGVFNKLGKTLDKATGTESKEPAPADKKPSTVTKAATPVAPAPVAPAPAAVRSGPVEVDRIKEGMSRAALIDSVGKPFMKISQTDEGGFSETYYYHGPEETVIVTLRGGKVTQVTTGS